MVNNKDILSNLFLITVGTLGGYSYSAIFNGSIFGLFLTFDVMLISYILGSFTSYSTKHKGGKK